MAKRGRPTKLNDNMKERLAIAYKLGLTDLQACKMVDIDESTLTKWKERFPDFFMAIKDWKAEADQKVEQSLYRRACGYDFPEQTVTDSDGKTSMVTKHMPPDATSMIFWLKNRQPDKWRDKQDVEFKGGLTVQVMRFTDGIEGAKPCRVIEHNDKLIEHKQSEDE